MNKEKWRYIEGYRNHYQVSSFGRVKGLKRTVTRRNGWKHTTNERIMKQSNHRCGYLEIILCLEGKQKCYKVHRLVASAFIDNLNQKKFINHKDCNKKNNKMENLEWVTKAENNSHALRMGLCKTKLSEKEVLEIRRDYIENDKANSQYGLAKKYGVNQSTVSLILSGRIWKHV